MRWFFILVLSACGAEPAYTTSYGIQVFLDHGVSVSQSEVEGALSIVMDEAHARKPEAEAQIESQELDSMTITYHSGPHFNCGGVESYGCATWDGHIEIAGGYFCSSYVLSHEWAHEVAYQYDLNGDGDHKDQTLFHDPNSLEKVGEQRIQREVCGLNFAPK